MKSIKQIAEEMGVTKQAVYKRYKGKLYKAVLPYARMVGDTIYILEQGESIIKQDFLQDGAYSGAHTADTLDTIVLMLKQELTTKNQLIKEQQQTIKSLTKTIKTHAENAAPKTRKRKASASKNHPKATKKSAPIERLINN